MALAARQGMAFDALDDVDDLEQQAAGGDVGLGQFQPQSVAQAERLAGPLADQHLAAFVVAEELLAERPDGDQPVGAGAVERHEQAEAGDAGDAAGEGGADVVGHEGRDIAVHGAALGRHGAPLAHGEVLAELGEAALVGVGQPAFAQAVGRDQGAMHDQVGIAADRRGEVGVARQRQAEMAEIVGAVDRLALAAQHGLVDQPGHRLAGDLRAARG